MLIDTHSHINFNAYRNDSDDVIRRALDNDTWIVNVGSQFSTSKRAVDIAEKYDNGVFAVVGLHPIHLFESYVDEDEIQFESRVEEFDHEKYKELAKSKKVVGIGEVGLDYFHIKNISGITQGKINNIKQKQKDVFVKQFKLAGELGLPVVIHCRDAHDDLIELIKELRIHYPRTKGVIHCFDGDYDTAKKYFELGLMISFTGIITFASGFDWIKDIPRNKFMIETDCPYLSPPPHRGERNEPVYVKYIAKRISEIMSVEEGVIEKTTTKNAKKFFNI